MLCNKVFIPYDFSRTQNFDLIRWFMIFESVSFPCSAMNISVQDYSAWIDQKFDIEFNLDRPSLILVSKKYSK